MSQLLRENREYKAIRECIGKGILKEYLTERGARVKNMLFDEYDYNMDIAVKTAEAKEEGIEIGHAEGFEEGTQNGIGIAVRNLMKNSKCTEEEAKRLIGVI